MRFGAIANSASSVRAGQVNLEHVKSSWDRSRQVRTVQVKLEKLNTSSQNFLDIKSFGHKFCVIEHIFWTNIFFIFLDKKFVWTKKC